MQPATVHDVVGVEVGDARDGTDERHEALRAQLVAQLLQTATPVVDVGMTELPLVQVEVVGPGGLRDGLELVVDRLQRIRRGGRRRG